LRILFYFLNYYFPLSNVCSNIFNFNCGKRQQCWPSIITRYRYLLWLKYAHTHSWRRIFRELYRQIRRILYRSLFCVNQWEEEKYIILLRYWLKSKGTYVY
jgi:hypothetical protein